MTSEVGTRYRKAVLEGAMLAVLLAADQGPPAAAPPRFGTALVGTGTALVVTGVGVGLGAFIQSSSFRVAGIAQPGWLSLTTSLSFLTTVGLTHLLVPLALQWADGGNGGSGSSAVARERGLLWGLVPMGVGALSCAAMFVGSALEGGTFGNGQAVLLVGFVSAVLSGVVHEVLAVIGARSGYLASWR